MFCYIRSPETDMSLLSHVDYVTCYTEKYETK